MTSESGAGAVVIAAVAATKRLVLPTLSVILLYVLSARRYPALLLVWAPALFLALPLTLFARALYFVHRLHQPPRDQHPVPINKLYATRTFYLTL